MMIYYFDSSADVNMSNLHQIKEVRPLHKILEKLVTSDVEIRYTQDYTEPGLYIVEVSKHTHQWTGEPNSYHTFNLLAEVPLHVIDAVKEKKIRLIILSTVEGGNFEKPFWDGFNSLQTTMKNLDLPKFSVVIVSANLKAGNQYIDWCHRQEQEPIIEWIGGIENPLQGYVIPDAAICGVVAAEKESPKNFSSLNRAASLHRIDHMYTLANEGLLENALVSGGQLNRIHADSSIMEDFPTFIECDIDHYRSVLKEHYPRSIDLGDLQTNNPSNVINFEIYHNSILSVVTETWYDDPGLTFSEKAFRPIATGNPQMILGQPEITKYLSRYGYNLNFKGLDLSFDNEFDHKTRFAMFHQSLKQWCNLSLEKKRHLVLKEWRDQLEENRKIHQSNNYGKFITDELISNSRKYFSTNL
jgi:hypothetical protein